MAVLVFAEHGEGALKGGTFNTLAAAQKIGGDVDIILAGESLDAVSEQAAALPGVRNVLVVDQAAFAHGLAENLAKLVAEVGAGYDVILASATSVGKNFLPRVAALLDVGMVSDVVSVEGPKTFKRPIYAGNAIATVESLCAKQVCTVRATAFDPVASTGGSASITVMDGDFEAGLSEFVKEELAESDRPELTAAKVVISGGRGMQSGENFKLLEGIADKLGAAIGASRAAVDAGFVPNDYQVGQTGKIVAPELYIAVGISGAIQHLAGMKDSKVIVAINKDEEAPIFQVADYGLVADLFEALPELEAAL